MEIEINRDYYDCFDKLKKRKKPTAWVIHHTCTTTPAKTRKALKDKGCSTHFEVDVDGTIYQYADVMQMTCHCGSPNVHTVGIDVTHPADAKWPEVQIKAVESLVDWLCETYGLSHEVHEKLEGGWPHKALGQTACPQDFPMQRLNKPDIKPKETQFDCECQCDELEDEEDFDLIQRIRQLMFTALADGQRENLKEMLKDRFSTVLKEIAA